MRQGGLAAALLLLLASAAGAQEERIAALLAEGNRLYEAGEWAAAGDAYQRILEYGVHHELVYYNLGNVRFKQGRLGEAILNYERALRLDPRDREAAENLAYASSLTVDRVEDPEPSFPRRALLWLVRRTTRSEDAALLLLAVWLLGGAAAASILARGRRVRRALLYVGAVLAGMVLWSGGALLLKEAWASAPRAVILVDKVDARSGPAADNTALFTVHEGLRVEVRNRREGWVQILLRSGLNGWVPASALGTVPENR